MASLLLPPCEKIQKALDDSIQPSIEAITLLSTYGTDPNKGIAVTVTANITKAITETTALQAILTPLGAKQPPFIIGVNNCVVTMTHLNLINTLIASATAQSVAAAGAPSPTFVVAGGLVTKAIEDALEYVTKKMVRPQDPKKI
mgnify:CR=1 FL=1|tara:strand:- start:149 stop:580 length:432 start_codon:yes stop_codon:yes gene_type:complete